MRLCEKNQTLNLPRRTHFYLDFAPLELRENGRQGFSINILPLWGNFFNLHCHESTGADFKIRGNTCSGGALC
jgi:hypothetical protein